MNKNQKIVMVVVAIVLLGMLLFPPFQIVAQRGTVNHGFGFILSPPNKGYATVNIAQLLTQMVVVGIVGGLAWSLLKK